LSHALSSKSSASADLFAHIRGLYRRSAGIASLVGLVAFLLAPHWINDGSSLQTAQLVFTVGAVITAIGYLVRARSVLLKARVLHAQLIVASIFRLIVGTSTSLYWLNMGYGIHAMLGGWALGILSELSLIWIFSSREVRIHGRGRPVSADVRKEMRKFGGKMVIWSLSGLMRERIDVQVLGGKLGSSAAAQYAVGTRLTSIFSDLMNAVFGSHFLAAFSEVHGRSERLTPVNALRTSLRISVPLSLIAGTTLFVFGPTFLDCWLGQGFEESHSVVRILAIPMALNLAQQPLGAFLGALNQHGEMVRFGLIGATFNLIVSLILVCLLGFNGVLIGSALELSITALVIWPVILARRGHINLIDYFQILLRPALYLSPVAGVIWMLAVWKGWPTNFSSLSAWSAGLVLSMMVVTWFFHLTKVERLVILSRFKHSA
jgi:O-antigen/teichoic acid export membrane protein